MIAGLLLGLCLGASLGFALAAALRAAKECDAYLQGQLDATEDFMAVVRHASPASAQRRAARWQ
ncbi:MAG: hypothetical protein ACRDK9_14025 [Solirubrobacterales bacterium]